MSLIQDELIDIKNRCESQIKESKLITCVPSMVQVVITKTKYKQLTICMQFPKNYPSSPLLLELKSKYLCKKYLDGLTRLLEDTCRKNYCGKPQVLRLLTFLKEFFDNSKLCLCADEMSSVKHLLSFKDEIKVKQRFSSIYVYLYQGSYSVKIKTVVPDAYPEEQIQIELLDSNFPNNFNRWFTGQCIEIARQCVQKPLKANPKDAPFEPKPSFKPALEFLINEVKRYPLEHCPLCKTKCFPDEPENVINNESDEMHIERVYCGHIFHNRCLSNYMKIPPFQGGKKCPECNQKIYHDKWKTTPKLAEERWAHKEAKKRELGEVLEFFY